MTGNAKEDRLQRIGIVVPDRQPLELDHAPPVFELIGRMRDFPGQYIKRKGFGRHLFPGQTQTLSMAQCRINFGQSLLRERQTPAFLVPAQIRAGPGCTSTQGLELFHGSVPDHDQREQSLRLTA